MAVKLDEPVVAAVDDGGPAVAPDVLIKPLDFEYEVCPTYFLKSRGPVALSVV